MCSSKGDNMKRIAIAITLLVLAVMLGAQSSYHEQPVAATDEVLAPVVNPAALGVENAEGFGWLTTWNHTVESANGQQTNTVDEFAKQYSLLFNMEGMAYVYERENGNSYHRLASGGEAFRNLYLGMAWDWNERAFHVGQFSASALYRPHNAISLGAVANFVRGEADDVYRFGAGVRPMAFFKPQCGHRVTLTADVDYIDGETSDPIFGVQLEPLDGLRLGGTYDVENETIGANFRIALGNSASGAIASFNDDNEFTGSKVYSHIASKPYHTATIKFGRKRFYEMKLKGELVDRRSFMRIGPIRLMRQGQLNMYTLIRHLQQLRDDPAVDGILVRECNMRGSFADYQELARAFNDFRAAGKEVVFYFDNASNMNYVFAANVADAIYLNPMGGIMLRGMSMGMPFVGELLDSLGVEIVNLQSHETKTAFNFLSESEMPESERESYRLVFGDIYNGMLSMLQEGRGDKLNGNVEDIVNNGPYAIQSQIEAAGLVDGFIYKDELEDTLENRYGKVCLNDEHEWETQRLEWSKPRSPRVAVIYATGNIHMGKSDPGHSIGSETISQAIRNAREDKSVKGIILRVDSGGGSAQASDIITRQVRLCTGEGEDKDTKPLVVSMGGAAASGGYYISTYADHIIAQPGTITGSIGVTGMLPNLAGLLRKVRVNWEVVRFGDHADIGSVMRRPSDDEVAMFHEMIEDSYQQFIQHVANGRGMTTAQVDPIAQGRIWTGAQALERGLVDELGGMEDAKDWMKNELHVQHITLVEFTGLEDKFGIPVEADLPSGPFGLALAGHESEAFLGTVKELLQYENERLLYRWSLSSAPVFE